jgi:hypothetical protein
MNPVRPIDQPLAWVGSDRILLNDRTTTGLRRMVIARKDDIPHQVNWLETALTQARGARVDWWLVARSDGNYLWIVWKEG